MALFEFNDDSYALGNIREVDTRKVTVLVSSDKDLRKARVGQLVAVQLSGASETWLIGMIDKVIKAVVAQPLLQETEDEEEEVEDLEPLGDSVINTVKITLMGAAKWNAIDQKFTFSRSLDHVPEIDSVCYVLKDAHLEEFMRVISECGDGEHSLELGFYKLNENARAYVDGNKLFQRHAALLGSTGSGKSWTVASILERSATLPSSNLVVFDLHGEYKELGYARQLRIPGPDEVDLQDDSILFLPYWLLNSEEIQSLFVDRSEFSAHNQVVVVQDSITEQKKSFLEESGRPDLLKSFTLDSPVPYSLDKVIEKLKHLNEEKVQGSRGPKNGPFNGEFSRLLVRMASRLNDRRYGFLFNSTNEYHQYDSLSLIAEKLMGFGDSKPSIKVIDFSEVPADILPVIVGLVARIIYQIQFWSSAENRRPIAFVCDEAHLYLPRKEGNPVERRAVEAFEKISKEGRKYGVALMVVSQRPSDVSATILSQCNNIISLRLTNADDQATVRKLLPESLESLLEALPIMDVGEAMVVGDSVLLPSRIKVEPPNEKPLSATIDFWSRWQEDVANPDFSIAVENMRRQSRMKGQD